MREPRVCAYPLRNTMHILKALKAFSLQTAICNDILQARPFVLFCFFRHLSISFFIKNHDIFSEFVCLVSKLDINCYMWFYQNRNHKLNLHVYYIMMKIAGFFVLFGVWYYLFHIPKGLWLFTCVSLRRDITYSNIISCTFV